MADRYKREADFEHTLKDGRVVSCTVTGRCLPPEGAFGWQVEDLVVKARSFANCDDAIGTEVTMDDLADEWAAIEEAGMAALFGDDHG